jgi:P27 family predicted phage terminase small subunit
MRRGPKPESAAVKIAKGNPSKRKIGVEPRDETKSDLPVVKAPDFLTKSDLVHWRNLSPRLIQLKLLSDVDATAFARYCSALNRWVKIKQILDKEGETYTVESPHGKYVRARPEVNTEDKLHRQLESYEAKFGLNPSDRQRIFAARAAGTGLGDLFDTPPASVPMSPAHGLDDVPKSLVGLLN